MAIPEPGEIYIPSRAGEIRDDILTDIRLELIRNGVSNPPVQPNTDWYVLASAYENVSQMQYYNIKIHDDDSNVLTATGDQLIRLRDAYGLPPVNPSPSAGQIIVKLPTGAVSTIVQGTRFVLPNGKQGEVSGTYINVANGDALDAGTVDTGADTVLAAGAKVRFVNPPLNVETEATVGPGGFTGGADVETDERLRKRILNRLQNIPAGGNWADVREKALTANASISDAFVYPALGGPGSYKVVLVRDFDRDNNEYTRVPDGTIVNSVTLYLLDKLPGAMDIVVQGPRERATDAALQLTLPQSQASGGNGEGWSDDAPWPELEVADGGRVEVDTVTSTTQITVSANTATPPVANTTFIMWWAPGDMQFRTFRVTAVAGSAGAWQLTLDAPAVDSLNNSIAVGDLISPAAENADNYGKTFVDLFESFGPEENTTDPNRLPRALRHPYATDESPYAVSGKGLSFFFDRNPEISDGEVSYTSSVVLVGSTVDLAPGILVPNRFGIYPQ